MLADRVDTLNTVPFKDLLELVGDPKYRQVLVALADNGHLTVDGDQLHGGDGPVGPEVDNSHLTRLATAGYIDWDRDGDTIAKGENFDELIPHLDNWTN